MERIRKSLAAQSLHTRGTDGESYTIDIEDRRQPDPARAAAHLVDDVRQGLRNLPTRSQEVVAAIIDEEPERAIGRRIGITRQRVDQIWKQSKRKLASVMGAMGYDGGEE
jgi:DNA-directed RNA polymerase specialized sigma subunit